jgi:alpha/beta superfamily hydrolase
LNANKISNAQSDLVVLEDLKVSMLVLQNAYDSVSIILNKLSTEDGKLNEMMTILKDEIHLMEDQIAQLKQSIITSADN